MRFGALLFLAAVPAFAEDAAAIMAKVVVNVEGAVEARKQYVYQQTVRASLVLLFVNTVTYFLYSIR